MAVFGKFPTQHWELEAEEHQEMMLNVLGGFYKKKKQTEGCPRKEALCRYLQCGQAGKHLCSQWAAQCQPPQHHGMSLVSPQHPGFKPSPPHQQRLASVLASTDGTMLAYKIPVPRAG